MRLRTKISLGILIGGAVLIAGGVPLFVVGAVGTKSLSKYSDETGESSSGYFNQDAFWNLYSGKTIGNNETFTKEFANDNGYSYNVIGLAKYWYDTQSKLDDVSGTEFMNPPSLSEVLDFYKAIPIDNSLFIAGSVLWPVGATFSLISGLLFFIFYRKDKQE